MRIRPKRSRSGGQLIGAQPNADGIVVKSGGTLNFYEGTIVSCKRGIYVKGSARVEGDKKKVNKKYVKKYKKIFTKKNCGKKVRVR